MKRAKIENDTLVISEELPEQTGFDGKPYTPKTQWTIPPDQIEAHMRDDSHRAAVRLERDKGAREFDEKAGEKIAAVIRGAVKTDKEA